jgi:hypothetical protein
LNCPNDPHYEHDWATATRDPEGYDKCGACEHTRDEHPDEQRCVVCADEHVWTEDSYEPEAESLPDNRDRGYYIEDIERETR